MIRNKTNSTIRTIVVITVMLSFMLPLTLRADDGGGQPGAFLRLGIGAKAMAMGRAFTAIANDVSTLYWNPAGMGQMQYKEFMGYYSALSMERRYNFVGFAIPTEDYGTFGAGWINIGISDIEARDISGRATGYFSNAENAFMFSWGMKVYKDLQAGASIKYLTHQLQDYQSTGVGLDIGFLYTLTDYFSIGLTIQDMATRVKWDTDSNLTESFPAMTRFGVAVKPPNLPMTIGLDLVNIQNESTTFHGGIEYRFFKNAGLRVGLDHSRLSAGAFFAFPIGGGMFQTGYSYGESPIDKSNVHNIAISIVLDGSGMRTPREALGATGHKNGFLKMMSPTPTARVIKVLEQYPDYILINAGSDHGVQLDLELNAYRLEGTGVDGKKKRIATIKLIRVDEKLAAGKVIWRAEGYSIEKGDILIRVDEDVEK